MKINFTFGLLLTIIMFGAVAARAEDRALVVGVDVYQNPNINETPGAADDAKAMRQLLIDKFKFAPESIKVLLDKEASAANIVQNFQTWLIDGTRPGDRVFFFYAGHGFQVPDDNADEEDKEDEVITPYDVIITSAGGKTVLPNEKTFIRDDKFNDFIAALSGRRTVLMFDSCHSGTLSRGLTANSQKTASRHLNLKPSRGMTDGVYSTVPPAGQPRDLYTIRETAIANSVNGVVIFSAASPYQEAFPLELGSGMRGAFSYLFETLVRATPNDSLDELDKKLKREMKKYADEGRIGKSKNNQFQVPQMEVVSKTNLTGKPLFGASAGDNAAAVSAAMFNPFSTMSVKLEIEKPRYKLAETINYTVDIGESGTHLYILIFSAENKAFCIFPSAEVEDTVNRMQKGRHSFPRENYVTKATKPTGKDVWVALISKKEIKLGEKEEYTWDEVFRRIGLDELQKAISDKVTKSRGGGNAKNINLTAADWQAASVAVEIVP